MNNDYERVANSIIAHCGGRQNIINKLECADYDSEGCAIIEILVDNHHGQYMPKIFCDRFDLEGCDDPINEDYWDNWTAIDAKLCDIIHTKLSNTDDVIFYLANSESFGDYCLMVVKVDDK